jgi:hypothetical protein
LEEKSRRTGLSDIGWTLWWKGHPVPERAITDFVIGAAMQFDSDVERLRDTFLDHDAAADLFEQSAKARLPSGILGSLRRRIGRDAFPTFLRIVTEVVTGEFAGLEDRATGKSEYEEAIVDKALGIGPGRRATILDVGPWITEANSQMLQDLTALIAQRPLSADAERLKPIQLARSRDEYRRVSALIVSFVDVVRRVWGRRALGFGVIADALTVSSPSQQAVVLLFWQRLEQDPAVRQNINMLLRTEAEWKRAREAFEGAMRLARLPAFSDLVNPKALKDAFKSNEALKALEVRLLHAYRANRRHALAILGKVPRLL